MMKSHSSFVRVLAAVSLAACFCLAQNASADHIKPPEKDGKQSLTIPGKAGPGKGKRIVFITGANEYNPEIGLPILARILATHHGFDCTVLFTVNKAGEIDPNTGNNLPGTEALDHADLLVILARFTTPTDEQMKHIVDYLDSGRPAIGMRTGTHSFAYPHNSHSIYKKFSWDNKDPNFEGGFGRQVLGETWITHHAPNGSTSTRGLFAKGAADDPILRGIADGEIWGSTGVYGVRLPLLPNCKTLLLGEVIDGGKPSGKPVAGKLNNPMMPIAWTRTYSLVEGKTGRVFTTTMGSADDLIKSAALRRMIVNAAYWTTGLEDKIPAKADVDLVGGPTPFKKGTTIEQLQQWVDKP
ncbi:MAG TPA: ThuA domain-containing protein [Pirellulales bacterium]|nr:ThuA domain-containing protein [Pirellulales bacterium]